MDLTALDVSHPVMESIYRQYYDEPRFRPSVITAQRLAGGVVGKKVGEGFYRYVDGVAQIPAEAPPPVVQRFAEAAARRGTIYQQTLAIEDGSARSAYGVSSIPMLVVMIAFTLGGLTLLLNG